MIAWDVAVLLAILFTVFIIIVLCICYKKWACTRNATSQQNVETEDGNPHALRLEMESNTHNGEIMEQNKQHKEAFKLIRCEVNENPSYQVSQRSKMEGNQIYSAPLDQESNQLYEALPDQEEEAV